nr:MAG TPA: hypothetical protein [Caudoviricetes sp.]
MPGFLIQLYIAVKIRLYHTRLIKSCHYISNHLALRDKL